jgi:hypothetical protein
MHQSHDHLLLLIVPNAVAKNPANTAVTSHAFGSHFVALIQYVPSANPVTVIVAWVALAIAGPYTVLVKGSYSA